MIDIDELSTDQKLYLFVLRHAIANRNFALARQCEQALSGSVPAQRELIDEIAETIAKRIEKWGVTPLDADPWGPL